MGKTAQNMIRRTRMNLVPAAVLFLILCFNARTARPDPGDSVVPSKYLGMAPLDDPSLPSDSSGAAKPNVRDSIPPPRDSSLRAPGHGTRRGLPPPPGGFFRSPTGTLLKSVVFPGWGQWSNGKKQKAAVYFGIETYFLTKALIWNHRASDRFRTWENTDPADETALRAAFNDYDSARNSRNYFYWLTGITAFVSMFDAYADSYLLTLERTRKMGDDYWGGQARFAPEDELGLAISWHF